MEWRSWHILTALHFLSPQLHERGPTHCYVCIWARGRLKLTSGDLFPLTGQCDSGPRPRLPKGLSEKQQPGSCSLSASLTLGPHSVWPTHGSSADSRSEDSPSPDQSPGHPSASLPLYSWMALAGFSWLQAQ